MNEQEELIKRLSFENWIWAIYIVVAIFSIYGDELIKKSIQHHDKKANESAQKIFLGVLIITILIYFYFLSRNYKDLEKHPNEKEYQVRFLGSILVISGVICFLYFQLNVTNETDSLSSI